MFHRQTPRAGAATSRILTGPVITLASDRSGQAPRPLKSDLREKSPQALARRAVIPTLLIPLLLAGCANPGPPKPPSLHLPWSAQELTALRTGDRVLLSWTTPANTTDGGALQPPLTASICRDDAPRSEPATPQYPTPPNPCKPILRVAVVPGVSTATDTLPPNLASGPPSLISYRIELLNSRNRSAGFSAPVYAAAGAAPAPAGPITVTTRRNGALITWLPRQTPADLPAAPMELERTLLATSAGPVASPSHKSATKPPPTPVNAFARTTLPQATLSAETDDPSDRADPGGMVDGSIQDGDTLTYLAQRVRSASFTTPVTTYISKDGKPRQDKSQTVTLEIRGEPSPPVRFVFHDTIPPSAPTGLAAVPGGGFGEPPSVDLSWDPNPEPDILGYEIYRVDAGSPATSFVRLNPEPVPAPAFRDLTAKLGKTYLYRITAVDQRHNESGPSQPLQIAAGR
jgi:hypothetical protein